ncbi:rCG47946, isoform CRA_a [Rattus norvegicus]|uniref:RCG47946, isoform CRA_a n=1 Tax=Rattus norvegicus TaxID=10116 RepID=A6HYE6_RAT|nr:rCG47946, isoform CRA_a [Rattus norvegicus]
MDNTPIICDYGSGFSKVGFAGTRVPLAVFPTILGKMKNATLLERLEEEDWFIGAEVQNNRPKLNIHYPIFRGAITNWDNVQKEGLLFGPSSVAALHTSGVQVRRPQF